MLSIIVLSVEFLYCYAACRDTEYGYTECRFAQCSYAECRYAQCRYACTPCLSNGSLVMLELPASVND